MRIGTLLSRMIPLSDHDVEEILHEQSSTNRRFGEVAMSLGLCRPEHVWRAWLRQLETRTGERVCLDALGVDVQAVSHLPAEVARRHRALPLRVLDGELLLAVSEPLGEAARAELESTSGRRVKFVLTDEGQLSSALERYYRMRPAA